jgi:hypothetical protein
VFQPFDKGPYDKRYDDTIAPAIKAAGLEPYRVDRDDGAVIPIETLHEQIRSATLCLADIGARNPNLMYELGFAVAIGKDVVIICSNQLSDKFPFDIQHRGIIQYTSDSASDFEKLKSDITRRIKALVKKQATTEAIAAASPVRTTEGLRPHEIASLAFVMVNTEVGGTSGASSYSIKNDMQKAGYTNAAAQLGLIRLTRLGFIEPFEDSDHNGDSFIAYRTTTSGQDWLLDNQDRFEIQLADDPVLQKEVASSGSVSDDDVPF